MSKQPGIFVAVAVLTFLGLLFQVAGLVMPWWFVIQDTVYIGVWYLTYCWGGNIGSGNCTVIAYNVADAGVQPGSEIALQWFFVIFQGCSTAAVGIILLCAGGILLGICGACKNKCAYVFCCVFLFLSGLLVCPALVLFGVAYIFLGSYFVETMSATSFPYAALASGLGCFVTFVAGITLAIGLCSWNTYMSDVHDNDYPGTQMTQPGFKQGYGNQGHTQGYGNRGQTQGYENKAYPGQGYEMQQQQHPQPGSNMYRPMAAKRY